MLQRDALEGVTRLFVAVGTVGPPHVDTAASVDEKHPDHLEQRVDLGARVPAARGEQLSADGAADLVRVKLGSGLRLGLRSGLGSGLGLGDGVGEGSMGPR